MARRPSRLPDREIPNVAAAGSVDDTGEDCASSVSEIILMRSSCVTPPPKSSERADQNPDCAWYGLAQGVDAA